MNKKPWSKTYKRLLSTLNHLLKNNGDIEIFIVRNAIHIDNYRTINNWYETHEQALATGINPFLIEKRTLSVTIKEINDFLS
jgi:hypothetical protein